MTFKKVIKWGNSNPKELFKIDGIGAIISAFLLGIVLVQFENVFGIPKSTLYFLASLPCFFALYDLYSYLNAGTQTRTYLRIIAIINIIYCFLSIGLAIFHWEKITILGWSYILVETMIVCVLAWIELKVSKGRIAV